MTILGQTVRRRRQELGWTLQQLALATGCSKAYLSTIETGRQAAPPSPRVLRGLERALDVSDGQLTRLAEWESTPASVRADFQRLTQQLEAASDRRLDGSMNLDALYRSGALQRAVMTETPSIQPMPAVCFRVPLINKVAAGYPTDFTDLEYPARVADEFVTCPGLTDGQAFAARVVGDSMAPEYRAGDIIVFSPARDAADGADCFVRLLPDHHTTFKRIYFESPERVRLQPLNPAFAPRVVELSEVSGLYPAVFRMQRIGG